MKIIDAHWELRNLGKKTVEIILDDSDFDKTADDIYNSISEAQQIYSAKYVVVRVPTGNIWLGDKLFRHGFCHVETQIHLKAVKEDAEIFLRRYAHLFKDTRSEEVSADSELENILNEIRRGVFTTDRISLDPAFNVEIANYRYANWANDLIRQGDCVIPCIKICA